MDMLLNDVGGPRKVPLSSVVSVEYTPTFLPSLSPQTIALAGNDASSLLNLIQFDNPYQPGGIPAAMVTGVLRVTFGPDGGGQETREFNVYNYRLLQDTASPDTFYFCTPALREALLSGL
jgi:hypothetical protein